MENCLAAGRGRPVPRPRRPADPRARAGHQPAVRGLLRRDRAGRLPAHRRRQRLPAGGFRRVRPQHPPRATAVGGPGLPAPGDEPAEPDRQDAGASSTRVVFEGNRAVGVEYRERHGPARVARAGQVILCGGAINTPQLLQLSGVGNARRAGRPRDRRRARPARRRREPAGPPRGLHPARLHAAGVDAEVHADALPAAGSARSGCSCARGPVRPTTSRAAASSAATRTSPTRT